MRFEEWLTAQGLPPSSDNGGNAPVQVGPAVESAVYRAASCRDKGEKERAKALIRVDMALLQQQRADDGNGDGGDGAAMVGWREGDPLPPVSRAYFKVSVG